MDGRRGVHGIDHRDLIHNFAQVGKDLADPHPTLPVLLKRKDRLHNLGLRVVFLRVETIELLFGKEIDGALSRVLLQQRLVVERFQVAYAAHHKQEDDILRGRCETRLLGLEGRTGRSRRGVLFGQQPGERDATETDSAQARATIHFPGCRCVNGRHRRIQSNQRMYINSLSPMMAWQ